MLVKKIKMEVKDGYINKKIMKKKMEKKKIILMKKIMKKIKVIKK
jgi:hypothetical protein